MYEMPFKNFRSSSLNLYVTVTVKHLHEKIITMETNVYGCLKMERSMRGAHFRNKYSHLLKFSVVI